MISDSYMSCPINSNFDTMRTVKYVYENRHELEKWVSMMTGKYFYLYLKKSCESDDILKVCKNTLKATF